VELFPQASAAYQNALERDLPADNAEQNRAAVRKELAECLVRLNRYPEALEVLNAMPSEPLPGDRPAIEGLRAECLRALGQTAEARKILDQALATYADSVDLYRLRAQLYLESEEPAEAVKLLLKALDIDRSDYPCRYQLLLAYQALNRTADADAQRRLLDQTQKDLTEMARLNREAGQKPWDPAPRWRLAELSEKLGRRELAERWRLAARACPPAHLLAAQSQPQKDSPAPPTPEPAADPGKKPSLKADKPGGLR
jgi:tetratricopeptide (TPR) repeat protein